MSTIENNTPFAARLFGMFDREGREQLVLVVTATFDARPGREAVISDEQLEIGPVDSHRGDPAMTSVHYPGHLAYAKPVTDVVVTGHAYAPNGHAVESMVIGLRVGDIAKTVVLSGDRFWRRSVTGRVPSSPARFERLPVIYERAFGGGAAGGSAFDVRNPVGVGLAGALVVDPALATEVPNVEYPADRMDNPSRRPAPAALGPIGPGWQPRLGFAGTYDARWLAQQAPLLPPDFDTRFFQVAPADQQSRGLRGGELVQITGMTPDGHWSFLLPRVDVPVTLVHRDRVQCSAPRIDTVHFEPDHYRVHVTMRLAIAVVRNRSPLTRIVVGAMRPGWLRAHYARKVYRSSMVVPR